MKRILFALCLLSATAAHAWKETGGGDEVGLEFTTSFSTAIENLKAAGAISGTDEAQFTRITDLIRVVVVNRELPVEAGEAEQYSVATNDRERYIITINRARWLKIKSAKQKEAIALHEVLSIIGVEGTGRYTYSEKYIALTKGLKADFEVPTAVIPKAKTLECQVSYAPTKDDVALPQENYDFKIKLAKNPDPTASQLLAKRDFRTKDGRLHIYVWATQPFRTPMNPRAFETTGIEVDDLKNKLSSVVGTFFPRRNENNATLNQIFDRTDASVAGLSAECNLN